MSEAGEQVVQRRPQLGAVGTQILDGERPALLLPFFRLAAQRIRWLLLDQAKKIDHAQRHTQETCAPTEAYNPSSRSDAPSLAALYQQVDELPDNERDVVDMIYFHGLSQAEAAAVLGLAERTVRRHWTAAKVKLFEALKDFLPGAVAPDAHG